ncbi:xanthine dehydrogenase family protein subunit M [Natrialba sp. INN-245]|uniref:FAD binding domain-containing protein n=1 Tax=Natrialba sp. INN-245 TaxID=2690967 RepID=UPI0013117BAB|nr:xanthine dehydrogenase family protein subunit M [Natrialba sp. INN-245]MWV38414.1 xanthine dehydrogenase family protein subunit M [Natrialba sp. INN-245]
MYPSEFDYERAETVDHALELLSGDPEAKIISGGHSLIPMMKSGLANPGTLVDIGEIDEMTGIEWDDDTVSVGALTTYATIADDDELWDELPVLAEAAHEVGDIQVRNRGTIGGNVAHGDPASDLPAAVLAADATVVVQGPDGERRIDVDDFFLGMYATELGEDEILTGLEFPRSENATTTGAYVKKPSPSSGYALVGVAVSLEVDDGRIESARVAANGIMDHAVRLEPVEDGLVGEALDDVSFEDVAEVADENLEEFMMMDDIQASAEFRAQLLKVYTEEALNDAVDRLDASLPTA